MNNLLSMTVLGWNTRNQKRHNKIMGWCRDYGFVPIMRDVHAGKLYSREKSELKTRLKNLLKGKTEKFFLVGVCRSCFNESVMDMRMSRESMEKPDFEILQMSRILAEKPIN